MPVFRSSSESTARVIMIRRKRSSLGSLSDPTQSRYESELGPGALDVVRHAGTTKVPERFIPLE